MDKAIIVFVIFAACVNVSSGFGIKDILQYALGGAGYGDYYGGPGYYPGGSGQYPSGPGQYPSGPGQYPSGPGQYPSGPGHYPTGSGYNPGYKPGPPGPPGAHAGCPLCDSSVYSYCSRKEAHDACCCGGGSYGYGGYGCRKTDCKFLHANSCQEYQLISSCCCVDVHKSAGGAPIIAPVA